MSDTIKGLLSILMGWLIGIMILCVCQTVITKNWLILVWELPLLCCMLFFQYSFVFKGENYD